MLAVKLRDQLVMSAMDAGNEEWQHVGQFYHL